MSNEMSHALTQDALEHDALRQDDALKSSDLTLQRARAVADAVMYEGYLLYPYRASSAKNQIRWQFGVLGPQGAAAEGVGEEPDLVSEILVRRRGGGAGGAADAAVTTVTVHLRFLQLQSRTVEATDAAGGFVGVDELELDGERWTAWDEAAEQEVVVATVTLDGNELDQWCPVSVEGGHGETTEIRDHSGKLAGRLVRTRQPLNAMVHLCAATLAAGAADGSGASDGVGASDGAGASVRAEVSRLQVRVENLATLQSPVRDQALGLSFLGAHLLLTCEFGEFVSLLDPPAELKPAAQECHQHRCWPVLAGPPGSSGVLLVSPIILEDHVSLAEESAGALFDSTEIDEILTLRILTMTEGEKAEARATDPRAGQIIDRSESLSTDEMARLHGALRNPHALEAPSSDVPWWDPEQDASVSPSTDAVTVAGRDVRRGSLVRIHPNRRADAQDLFFADQTARVTGVHFDVDGATHVGVVLVDDPAADLHDWYGRYLYFDPDELEPVDFNAVEPYAGDSNTATAAEAEAAAADAGAGATEQRREAGP